MITGKDVFTEDAEHIRKAFYQDRGWVSRSPIMVNGWIAVSYEEEEMAGSGIVMSVRDNKGHSRFLVEARVEVGNTDIDVAPGDTVYVPEGGTRIAYSSGGRTYAAVKKIYAKQSKLAENDADDR